MRWLALMCLALLPKSVWAQVPSVSSCYANQDYGIEDLWHGLPEVRTYANGDVRVMLMHAGGHSGPKLGLVIFHPPLDENVFSLQCSIVSPMWDIDMDRLNSSYDPTLGLGLSVPILYTGDVITWADRPMTARINQQTGELSVDLGEATAHQECAYYGLC